MNERQFQGELVAEAPTSVPDSLRERVDAIAVDASQRDRPDPPLATAPTPHRALGLTDVIRQRRTLAMLVCASWR